MRTRFFVLCAAAILAFGAHAAPVHASSADQAYTAKLRPVFSEMVTAAQKVVTAGNAITGSHYSSAAKSFTQSLSLYKQAQNQVNALHPSSRMTAVQHYVQLSLASYIKGVNLYLAGANKHDPNEIMKGVAPYNQGTKYLNKATAALRTSSH